MQDMLFDQAAIMECLVWLGMGSTVYFMEAHLIFVAAVGGLGELASLVGVQAIRP